MEYDEEKGVLYLMELLPEEGDRCMIICVGPGLYEIHRSRLVEDNQLTLTDDEIERLRQNAITWH